MFSDLSIAVQIPKRASITLENQLRLFVFHSHLVTGVRFCPSPQVSWGQMLFLFHFLFGDLTGQAIGAPPIEVQWQRADKT
jgi:hypothetical protein